jgi:hypothetical protein
MWTDVPILCGVPLRRMQPILRMLRLAFEIGPDFGVCLMRITPWNFSIGHASLHAWIIALEAIMPNPKTTTHIARTH